MTPEVTQFRNDPYRPAHPRAEPQPMQPREDLLTYLREYARERPDVAAMWCFGIGFVLGWKLKPW